MNRRGNSYRNGKQNNSRLNRQENTAPVPQVGKDTLRIIPIGGNEEVGRNLNIVEYGNDIVIIDMGIQFPEEDMPGIDYIIPNISYLKGKEKNVRAVVFTHGHLDHIGAAAILLQKLNYPPIIAKDLTIAMVKKKIDDYDPASLSQLKTIRVSNELKPIQLGSLKISFFDVDHSILDAIGIAVESPAGTALHLGDWTINHDPLEGEKAVTYENLQNFVKPTVLMLESLGAIKTEAKSEKVLHGNLESLIDNAAGRIIIGTFASQVKRVIYILRYAEKIGKKVILDGYSMKTNMEIADKLGYLKIRKETVVSVNDINKYPDNKIVMLCTGSQGEQNAVFSRLVTGNHRFVTLKKQDTIVFSSSVIPGNERTIQRLKDDLYRKCDNVIHSDIMDIHMSGHAVADDIKTMLKQTRPTFFMPIYANHFFLKEAAKRAMEIKYPKDNIFVLDNGQVLDITKGHAEIRKEKADSSYVFVDGLGVGDIGHVVLRDRQMLAEDGMFAVTVIIDSKTKEIVGNMQITSRGFIYVKDNFDLVNDTKKEIRKIIKKSTSQDTSINWRFVENNIRDHVGEFLFRKTQRRPMVLPVVIEV